MKSSTSLLAEQTMLILGAHVNTLIFCGAGLWSFEYQTIWKLCQASRGMVRSIWENLAYLQVLWYSWQKFQWLHSCRNSCGGTAEVPAWKQHMKLSLSIPCKFTHIGLCKLCRICVQWGIAADSFIYWRLGKFRINGQVGGLKWSMDNSSLLAVSRLQQDNFNACMNHRGENRE